MNPPPIDGGDRHLQRRVIPADGRRPPKQEANHVARSSTAHAPISVLIPRGPQSPRLARRLARLAMAAVIAIPIGAGMVAAQPANAEAATRCIYISGAKFNPAGPDSSHLNGEYVKVANRCASMINIKGWKVRDKAGNTYTFGSLRMGSGTIYLHTGRGIARPGHRYWGRTEPVWGNSGEKAYLYRGDGSKASSWPRTASSGSGGSKTASTSTSWASWKVKFGSRRKSGPIVLRNCRNVTISNRTFRDLGGRVNAIRLENCHNVTIRYNDFINVAEGVYAFNSTNIKVLNNRYRNITGPSERTGANTGNFVQFHDVQGGKIDHNKGKGGDTEDVISLFQTSKVIVEDNHFEGTNWTSHSSSGIALGDGGGSNNIARRNTLVNIGQVGAYIAGGTNNQILNNKIYGGARSGSNVGIYVANYSGGSCSGHDVKGNRVYFRKSNGVESGYWGDGSCGHVSMSGNDFSAPLSVSALRVRL
jgi:parallel beta-helix repeat protein